MDKVALAIDIGATKVALALVGRDYSVRNKQELIIGNSTTESLWGSISSCAGHMIAGLNGSLLGVGIGSAGPLHLEIGAISPVNIPIWRKYPIVQKFRELSGSQNVVLHGAGSRRACNGCRSRLRKHAGYGGINRRWRRINY
jgi:glucokinase